MIAVSYYVIIRGPLGVGKTTVAKGLAKKLNAEYISVDAILSENKLNVAIDGSIPVKNFIRANDIAIPKAQAALKKGKPVIVDGNFYYRKQIVYLVEKLGRSNYVFTLKAPLKVCVERDGARPNSHGAAAAKEVFKLVSESDYGTLIDTANKAPAQVVSEIATHLK